MKLSTVVTLAIMVTLFFVCGSLIANAAPLPGYAYVKTHAISGSTDGALTDYQVKLVVHSGSGTDSGQDVYLNGHSQNWPNDIRFTNSAGAILNYWIESYDSGTATVWVKVDSIPASPGTATIILYYGNASDIGASSGADTFLLYDDFNSLNAGLWGSSTAKKGSCSVTGGSLQVSSTTQSGSYGALTTIDSYPINNVAVGSKYRLYISSRGYNGANFECSGSYIFMPTTANTWDLNTHSYTWLSTDDDDCYRFSKQGTQVYQDNVVRPTSWSNWISSEVRTTDSSILAFKNGAQVYSDTFTGFSNAQYKIRAEGQGPNNYGSQYLQVDYVYIRKYTASEPAHDTWSAEALTVPLQPPAGYAYVKAHDIMGSSDGALSNYQVKLIVHSGSGSDSGQDVYLNGHSLSWPNDIRFTNNNYWPLSYWIESYDANTAIVWVKVDSIPASPASASINLYYGKADDIGESNSARTFILYDDFNDNSIDTNKWQTVNSGAGESNAEIRIAPTNPRSYLQSKNQYAVPYILEYRAKAGENIEVPICWDGSRGGFAGLASDCYFTPMYDTWTGGTHNYCIESYWSDDGTWGNTQYQFTRDGNYHTFKIVVKTTGIDMYIDNVLRVQRTVPTAHLTGYIGFSARETGNGAYYDDVRLSAYTANDPAQGSWSPETSTTPTPTPTSTPTPTATPTPTPILSPPSIYSYAKIHTIQGSTDGSLTDYPVMLAVHRGSGTDSGQNVYLNDHSLNWPNDIRFTDINNSVLNYWIESNDTDNAIVWVEIPFIPADPATTILNLYYSNANDPGDSNNSSTIVFYNTTHEPTQLDWSTESFLNIVYDAEYISDTIPSEMTGCQQYNVSITMKNTGNTTWSNDTLVMLAATNGTFNDAIFFANNTFYISDGVIVQPGQTYNFDFMVIGLGASGTYNLSYQMFKQNNGSFGSVLNKTVTVQAIQNAVYITDNIPSTMNAGESYNVSITMGNTGSLPWLEANNVSMGGINGSSGDAAKFSSIPVTMSPDTVTLPNQFYTFNFTMTAPLQGGTYNPQYRMARNGSEWFGETVNKNIDIINSSDGMVLSAAEAMLSAAEAPPDPTPTPTPGFTPSLILVMPSATPTPPIYTIMPVASPPQLYTQTKTYPVDLPPYTPPDNYLTLPPDVYYNGLSQSTQAYFTTDRACKDAVDTALDQLDGDPVSVVYSVQDGRNRIDIVPTYTGSGRDEITTGSSYTMHEVTTLEISMGINKQAAPVSYGQPPGSPAAAAWAAAAYALQWYKYQPKTIEQMKHDLYIYYYVDVYSFDLPTPTPTPSPTSTPTPTPTSTPSPTPTPVPTPTSTPNQEYGLSGRAISQAVDNSYYDVPGVTVFVTDPNGGTVGTFTTDGYGRWSYSLGNSYVPGYYHFTYSKQGYVTKQIDLLEAPSCFTDNNGRLDLFAYADLQEIR